MMEFEDQHEVEEEEEMEEEEEEDDDDATLPQPNYDSSLPNSSSRPFKMPTTPHSPAHGDGGPAAANNEARSPSPPPLPLSLSFPAGKRSPAPARYRECLKNHAVGLGGHAVDGCCEFMPAGPEGSLDALKCAACNCHRNFHRKEAVDPSTAIHQAPQNHQRHHHPIQTPIAYFPHPHPQHQHQHPPPIFQFYPYGRASPGGYPNPQQRPLALPSTSGGGSRGGGEVEEEAEMISEPMSAMGLGSSSSGKKRFRTKFTAEQKEKMLELAEKVGWSLQKQDEPLIQHFCDETGVKRHVLKVWMHNNKHTLGKRNPSI